MGGGAALTLRVYFGPWGHWWAGRDVSAAEFDRGKICCFTGMSKTSPWEAIAHAIRNEAPR